MSMTLVSSFTLSGTEAAARLLQSMANVARGENLERAVVAGALPVVNAAKVKLNTTPSITGRGSITETGNLARSIHVGGHAAEHPGLEGDTTGTDIGGNIHTETMASVLAGTNVVYARRVEYGFMGTDALGRKYHQPAQPYLRPSFDENRAVFRQEVIASIRAQLRAYGVAV
jgi:hypothetical protein